MIYENCLRCQRVCNDYVTTFRMMRSSMEQMEDDNIANLGKQDNKPNFHLNNEQCKWKTKNITNQYQKFNYTLYQELKKSFNGLLLVFSFVRVPKIDLRFGVKALGPDDSTI